MSTPLEAQCLATSFEPGADEVAGMIAHLSDRYSPKQWQILTGVGPQMWALVAAGKRDCDVQVKRIVWFLYMLDTRPDELMADSEIIWCWGKQLGKIPKLSQMTAVEKQSVLFDYIRMIKMKNHKYSVDEIAAACAVAPGLVVKACKKLKYRTALHNVGDVYVAGSRWYEIDWRLSIAKISQRYQIPVTACRAAREKLMFMPVELLARNILHSSKAKFLWFWHLWDDAKQFAVRRAALRMQEEAKNQVDKHLNHELIVIQHDENQKDEDQKAGGGQAPDDQHLPDGSEPCVPGRAANGGPQHELGNQPGAGASTTDAADPGAGERPASSPGTINQI